MIKLLHVEDDHDILEIALMSLEISGEFEVRQYDNGYDALENVEAFAPDLLLLDVMMPGISGLQLLEKFREMPSLQNTPVIFMTARAQQSEQAEMLQKGVAGVIVKPFDPMTLSDQIKAKLAE